MPSDVMISPDMVANISFDDRCMRTYPCKHFSIITLVDGRTRQVTLDGIEIYSLMQEIDAEKINSGCDMKSHVEGYVNNEPSDICWTIEPAEKILTRLF